MASPEIETLASALAKLPGFGPRSARRAVLYLIKKRETALSPLLRALEQVEARMTTCEICGNVDTINPCGICTEPRRDSRMLCVVEDVSDLWALERSRLFPGKFHILGGHLSALSGMNATLDGQTTAHYIAERLETYPVRLTQLAHGLPVGGELDYLDDGTLAQAMRARRPVS
jgi:recombination protein RecR